jgi:hypothetical protein
MGLFRLPQAPPSGQRQYTRSHALIARGQAGGLEGFDFFEPKDAGGGGRGSVLGGPSHRGRRRDGQGTAALKPFATLKFHPSDGASAEAQPRRDLPFASALLVTESVERAQTRRQNRGPRSEQVKQLRVPSRSSRVSGGGYVLPHPLPPTPEIGRLMLRSPENPRDVDRRLGTNFPERDADFLNEIGQVLGLQTELSTDSRGHASQIGGFQPLTGGQSRARRLCGIQNHLALPPCIRSGEVITGLPRGQSESGLFGLEQRIA